MVTDKDIVITGRNCDINSRCSRWDVQNQTIIIETWLTKSEYQDLMNSVVPGAIGEMNILTIGTKYYDNTWGSPGNTLVFTPTGSGTLKYMRSETVAFPKTITSRPLAGDSYTIDCKIEAMISGSWYG